MKKFLIKISLFVLPIMLLLIPLDKLISKNLAKSNSFANGEYLVYNDIYNGTLNAEIMIYGSSRAWRHFNSAMIEDSLGRTTYNLGINGHNFWLQYLRHKELMKNNQIPKFIIMSVDVFSLAKRPDLYNYKQFLPYSLFNQDIKTYTSSYEGFSFWDYNMPLSRYYGEKWVLLTALDGLTHSEHTSPARIKGYMGLEGNWNGDFEKAKAEAETTEIKIDTATKTLFYQFLAECKAKSIQVILVYSPEHVDGQAYVSNRKEVMAIYTDASIKMGVPYLNYSNDGMCLDRKYFFNASHLNKLGSDTFTNKLVRDLRKMDGTLHISASKR